MSTAPESSDAQKLRGTRTNSVGRRSDLQGMRAVAVLAVFANHLFSWPRGGFVGVDVFFVLSGFFITGLLIRERTDAGTLSFADFYVRRVKRILPVRHASTRYNGSRFLHTSARCACERDVGRFAVCRFIRLEFSFRSGGG